MKQSQYKKIIVIGFLFVSLLGIVLPGTLLHFTFSSNLNEVQNVPEEYYNSSSSTIFRNTSAKLSEYERIKLISGAWDSTLEQADISESTLNDVAVAELARTAVDELYTAGCYPYEFGSSYDNWYSWKVQSFRCTENSFHTYSTYCFLVTFYRYDDDEVHEVLITESGTLLNIRNNRPSDTKEKLSGTWGTKMENYFKNKYSLSKTPVTFLEITKQETLPAYTNMNLTSSASQAAYILVLNNSNIASPRDLDNLISSEIPENTELYYVYQSYNTEYFMITIIPWEQPQQENIY